MNGNLWELTTIFLRLGFTAFGGPVAHIALFRDEFVKRRGWLTDEHFLDLLGAVNLIPGPNSTEMAIHIGYLRGGRRGLLLAGMAFILPAALIVGILAHLYVQFGTTPQITAILYGIKPVIIAIILQAIYGLLKTAVKNVYLAIIGVGVLGLYLLGGNEILLLFVGGLLYMLIRNVRPTYVSSWLLPMGVSGMVALQTTLEKIPVTLDLLFLTFLKIGSVLYGSGYVLLAFLRNDFVERLGWLTNQQLLDAVAIGQFTPGPLFTTATFVGYLVAGVGGAVLATIGIFLPAFVFVYISSPFIPKLRQNKWLSALLDGVNVAALGLMTAVTLTLAQSTLIDIPTVCIAIAAAILFIHYKVNSTWLILGGGLIGLLMSLGRI
jgi:chromate transporter